MELKVWVDGVQRVVCGVTEATTCQEVVIALAQAIGRTGRYTLIEKWRDSERHLAPHESPVASLNTWGQYAGDVQFILHRTGPSLMEHPPSEALVPRGPERGLHRQSLPIMAKLRAPGDRSLLRRREPRRKSLTFTGGPRGLRDILSGARLGDSEVKRRVLLVNSGHRGPSLSPRLPGNRLEDLSRLVRLQRETLAVLDHRMEAYEAELQAWSNKRGSNDEDLWAAVMDELACLEQQMRKNQVEVEEEEFWASELQIERESERQLEERLQELRNRLHVCEAELDQRLACLQGVEAGLEAQRLQKEMRATQQSSEGEVKARLQRVKAELKAQAQHTAQLESSCRAVERSLSQSSKRLQESQYELEQLTKELRQVNLQQFIQQTGTKVTVLPVEPSDVEASPTPEDTDFVALTGSLKRPSPSHTVGVNLRVLHSPITSSLNPEGIYV
ncbi:ras association domain-containing protein 8 [Pygocentrus nattereri]|uniref:Ras-associating domain-containing protein n=1 Tax=Pygocentrus nattereri TaxID=42514 RepID=A0A3B4DDM7_PYGNA|nr:ras association domain-containing protein 8 [Pygocentrus nattereri]XP_017555611.1 ras association domain-containing protein 8 [Pygocentrus nattereri]XP_017555612.1 ras association domain-containing protein 8 [Pygocentrus nattereri]